MAFRDDCSAPRSSYSGSQPQGRQRRVAKVGAEVSVVSSVADSDSDVPWSLAEVWLRRRLIETGVAWRRTAPNRFWNAVHGLRIELGTGHGTAADAAQDRAALLNAGILVVRVAAFQEVDATAAVEGVRFAGSWNARRRVVGLGVLVDVRSERQSQPWVRSR